jgi:hypothetical protein
VIGVFAEKWAWEEKYVTGLVPDARAYHVASLVANRYALRNP